MIADWTEDTRSVEKHAEEVWETGTDRRGRVNHARTAQIPTAAKHIYNKKRHWMETQKYT